LYFSVHFSTIHDNQDAEKTKCPPVDERIEKMWCRYIMKYYTVIRKNEILSFLAT
jgi:hypothetical protein